MKIGLYTIHASFNVGAMLQAYALIHVLQKYGAEVELVNLYTREEEAQNHNKRKTSLIKTLLRESYIFFHPKLKQMEKNFDLFHRSLPLSQRFYTQQDYIKNPNQYDLHLIGSDQVWNMQKGYEFARFFLLDYLPANSAKISYGASLGTTEDIKDIELFKSAIMSFKKISVREDKAVDLIHNLTGSSCYQVVDPTLLLNQDDWNRIIEGTESQIKGRYILFYGVNRDHRTWIILQEAKRILNLPIVGYPGPIPSQYHFDNYILDGGPKEFINVVKNAELIVTSSFHGLAFAINYRKKFIIAKYGGRMERLESLIRLVEAEEHVAESEQDVSRILQQDNNDKLQERLGVARQQSVDWIVNNILNIKK